MLDGWALLFALLATLGLPMIAIGVVFRLCEWSWQKPFGSMGSAWLLVVGGLLCLPLLLYLAPVLLERLSG